MKKTANFLVEKRIFVLAAMLMITVACALFSLMVNVNSDMTKYLPDNSRMKAGIDLMDKEFPATEDSGNIRVMFNELDNSQKQDVLNKLKSIEYIDSVDYDAVSADYNNGEYTLYIVNFKYDYDSKEASAVVNAIASGFEGYSMVYHVNNDSKSLPTYTIVMAAVILMTILFLMCESWLEPFLLIAAVGIAVVINMGTNIFLGTISDITSSIAAILQLVLSLDYSMILMNRFRQELALSGEPKAAMKSALVKAFPAIASSATTTVIGLLALCLMSFKIGMDMGIVLAKGVLISMICIFTILSVLLVVFQKGIRRTEKKVLPLKMNVLGKFSNKYRYIVTGVFVLIFVGAFFMRSNTGLAYVLAGEDPTEEYFPKDSSIVVLYNNDDEEAASKLADKYAGDPNVKDVQSYSTTLGKEYTAEELSGELGTMDDSNGLNMDASLLNIIYYDYYKGNISGTMTVSNFIGFISNDVLTNESFAAELDDDLKDQFKTFKKFADPENLIRPMDAEEIAGFFDMDPDDAVQLFMFYYMKNGGVDSGAMTLADFSDFIINDVATNEDYASMFDKDTLSMIDQLKIFTDKEAVTRRLTSSQLASKLDMDQSTVQLLLVYYYTLQSNFNAGTMTVPQFVDFLTNDVASNPTFAAYFDPAMLTQMSALAQYTNTDAIQQQMSKTELATALGMDAAMVDQIFYMYYSAAGATADWKMTLPEFTGFLVSSVLNNDAYASYFDENLKAQLISLDQMFGLAISGTQLTSSELAGVTGMDSAMIDQLFAYASTVSGSTVTSMSLSDFLTFVIDDVAKEPSFSAYFDAQTLENLNAMYAMTQAATSGQEFTAEQIASYLSMDSGMAGQIFYMYFSVVGETANWTMSMQKFVNFLLSDVVTNEQYSSYLDDAAIAQLKFIQNIMNATITGGTYSCGDMAAMFGMDPGMSKMLYTYYISEHGDTSNWKISLKTTVDFIVNDLSSNSAFGSMISSKNLSDLKMLQKLIKGTVAGTSYTSAQLGRLLDMDSSQTNDLYLLYNSEYGDTSDWNMSIQGFVNFINSDILTDTDFSDQFNTDEADKLKTAKTIIDGVVSGNIYTSKELADMFSGFSDKLDEITMDLMYLYYFSTIDSNPAWKLSIDGLFNYLSNNVMNDSRFDEVIDADMRSNIGDAETELTDGKKQLTGPDYSRMILTVSLQDGSDESNTFISELSNECNESFGSEYYLIGNSPMIYEMSQSFDGELNFITLITAIAIFIVIAVTFRSFLIPIILVLIIQGGVFLTVSLNGMMGTSIYYLAFLIVECILMGATIDYGILYTSYYKEFRKSMGRQEALAAAYNGSAHTVFTSGLIMVLVTGIVGMAFKNPTIGQICLTISKGALCAVLLIIFILPGIIATFDRFIVRRQEVKPIILESEKFDSLSETTSDNSES